MVFAGNANPELARKVAEGLDNRLGHATVGQFSDGEIAVEINENVRGKDVFILQSTCAPTNDNLLELILMVDALRRASATRITAVVPYFGYARQDRRVRSARVPISAKVVADMMVKAGVDRVMTMDLHADQIQGFFDVPVDNVYGSPILLDDIERQNYDDLVVVSPDVGGVVRARAIAKQLNADLAIIDKRRPQANQAQVMHIIGEIEDRTCVVVDDMVDTPARYARPPRHSRNMARVAWWPMPLTRSFPARPSTTLPIRSLTNWSLPIPFRFPSWHAAVARFASSAWRD